MNATVIAPCGQYRSIVFWQLTVYSPWMSGVDLEACASSDKPEKPLRFNSA